MESEEHELLKNITKQFRDIKSPDALIELNYKKITNYIIKNSLLNTINLVNNLKHFENKQLDENVNVYDELLDNINKQLVIVKNYDETLNEMAKNLNFFKWNLKGN